MRFLRIAACATLIHASLGQAEPAADPALSPLARLGRMMFFDAALSASGRQSCASCHDPAHAYAPANDRAVQLGGPNLDRQGTRAVPTLMYKNYTRPYSDSYPNPDRISPPGPGGGFGWDGRAGTLAEQAALPLLAANEMANAGAAALTARLRKAGYGSQLRELFGKPLTVDRALAMTGAALEAFQIEDRSFHPYSSRFDRFRNNKLGGTLSIREQRGFTLYMRQDKGNCNACHLLGPGDQGSQDVSTDYSFAALGVPRNLEVPANIDPAYFDLGLCGPLRKDHAPRKPGIGDPYCGLFKTPVLRNVATRHVFMHNGYFKSLRDVVRFYATRDTDPAKWYPVADGRVQKFNDLPVAFLANLDLQAPLDQRGAGAAPALSDAEIDDLVVFLKTLTDEGQDAVESHGH